MPKTLEDFVTNAVMNSHFLMFVSGAHMAYSIDYLKDNNYAYSVPYFGTSVGFGILAYLNSQRNQKK